MHRVALTIVLFCSCGLPQPVPIPDASKIRVGMTLKVSPVQVVGLPGAVSAAAAIVATSENADGEVGATAAESGSFVLSIEAVGGGTITLRVEGSDPVELEVRTPPTTPSQPPAPRTGVPPISSPDGGKVTIEGQTSNAEWVIAANLDTGDVSRGAVAANGSFGLELPAASGQLVRVFNDNEPSLGGTWDLTVP